mgnify:CR=1 FL=1
MEIVYRILKSNKFLEYIYSVGISTNGKSVRISPKDILKMQQQTTKAIRKFNKQGIGGSNIDSSFSMPQLASDSIGSVLIDE